MNEVVWRGMFVENNFLVIFIIELNSGKEVIFW